MSMYRYVNMGVCVGRGVLFPLSCKCVCPYPPITKTHILLPILSSPLTPLQQDLDEGAAAIKSLVENLDRQKDEAIIRTFRGVSKHFADVFKELVPNGHGAWVDAPCGGM